jgi:hypothetical protein
MKRIHRIAMLFCLSASFSNAADKKPKETNPKLVGACGYPTPAHFQRQFYRHQKRSPLIYRSAVRKQG